jgi:hypothetical protein
MEGGIDTVVATNQVGEGLEKRRNMREVKSEFF